LENAHTSLRLTAAGQTHPGQRRPLNEDAWRVASQSDTGKLWSQRGRLFAVADGMGGHAAGEVASQLAVETLMARYYADDENDTAPPAVRLEQAILAANSAVHEQATATDSQAGMGTTLVAAVVRDNWLTVANVGDSRAYLVRNGVARQLTRDHSWVAQQVAAGVLNEQEAREHIYRNVVTRCLGHRPDIQVDLFAQPLRAGDVVLLCSDGLSNQVSDAEIADALTSLSPKQAAERLIALANERGGPDNVTAVVFKLSVTPTDQEPADEPEAPSAKARVEETTLVARPSVRAGKKKRPRLGLLALLLVTLAVVCSVGGLVAWNVEQVRNLIWPPTRTPAPSVPPLVSPTPAPTDAPTDAPTGTPTAVPTPTATTTRKPTPTSTSPPAETPTATPTPTQSVTPFPPSGPVLTQ